MRLPGCRENHIAEAHPGNEALGGGLQMRGHRQRHGRPQHRQEPDRPIGSGTDGWEKRYVLSGSKS